jgi:flagellar basal-body rod protein FlgG
MNALEIASRGMMAQQVNVEIVANNLANMNTTAYVRRAAEFQDLVYNNISRPDTSGSKAGALVPGGIQAGHGVRMAGITVNNEQGSLKSTGNPFDLAVQGGGYFEISLPSGDPAYTRDGTFQLNAAGELVTHDGYPLSQGIVVPAGTTDVTINPTGEVWAKVGGQADLANIGQIQLFNFINPAALEAQGNNMFTATTGSGEASPGIPGVAGYGSILQGYVESSNVDPIREVASMVAAQRAYEMNSKVVKAADEMLAPAK